DLSSYATTAEFPRAGVPFTIELRLYNFGPDTVNNATLTTVLPAQWSIISCNPLSYLIGPTIGTPYDPSYIFPSWTNSGQTFVGSAGTIYNQYYRAFFLTVVSFQPGTYNHSVSAGA